MPMRLRIAHASRRPRVITRTIEAEHLGVASMHEAEPDFETLLDDIERMVDEILSRRLPSLSFPDA